MLQQALQLPLQQALTRRLRPRVQRPTQIIAAAAATALTLSDTSNVQGAAFDRILQVYLETTAYENAIADRVSLPLL